MCYNTQKSKRRATYEKKYKIIIGVVLVLWVLTFFTNGKDSDVADNEVSTEMESEVVESEIVETESEINVDELTEEEYKAICEEVYDDYETKFQDTLQVGQHIKLYGYLAEGYLCYETNVFNSTDYDLEDMELTYYVCRVQDEGRSLDFIPGFNETIELYFLIDGTVSGQDFQTGQTVLLYGEVVQVMEYSGVFVIPKYMEVVEVE